ncbi:MAG: histidinol-phosphatase HisJ family protein [Oscillospiraceae bacterium]
MSYNKLLDMHTHTDNSPDGEDALIYMCECAQSKGLRAIAFTDHCEVDAYKKEKSASKIATQAYFETVKARRIYEGRLVICTGIELGQPTYDIETAEEIISRYKYDIILGSIHNLREKVDFYYLDYTQEDIDALIRQYFTEELELANWSGFDSLAHLTYPLRYLSGNQNYHINLDRYSDYTDEILKALAHNGKALEINTSGLRQKLKDTMPNKNLLKRFKELGGEFVTIGSDSHKGEDIGSGIEQAMQMCVECGFNEIALYQNREPMMISIE